jgi:hypothetical protein
VNSLEVDWREITIMSAKAEVEAGICGFRTRIEAKSEDSQNVSFLIETDCEKIRELAERLKVLEPIDAYMEIHPGGPSLLMGAVREVLVGCCAGCAVPVGIFKSMQVAADLALPKDVVVRIAQ